MTGKTVYLEDRKVLIHISSRDIVVAILLDKLLYEPEKFGRLDHRYIPVDVKMEGL